MILKRLILKNNIWKINKFKNNIKYFSKNNIFNREEFNFYQKINLCENDNEIMKFYEKNKNKLNFSNSIFLLKTYLIRYSEKNLLNKNSKFINEILTIINYNFKNFDNFNYLEILNIILILKNYKYYSNIISETNKIYLKDNIEKNIKNKVYGLKTLSFILNSFINLKLNADFIIDAIYEKIDNNLDWFFYSIINIISSSISIVKNSNKLNNLIIFIINKYGENFLNYKFENKLLIFKYLSFSNSELIKKKEVLNLIILIKEEILKNEHLNETDINKILKSYIKLPINFDNDLLLKVRNFVLKNLEKDLNYYSLKYLNLFFDINNKIIKRDMDISYIKKLFILIEKKLDNNKLDNNFWNFLILYKKKDIYPQLFEKIYEIIKKNKNKILLKFHELYILKYLNYDIEFLTVNYLNLNKNKSYYNLIKLILDQPLNENKQIQEKFEIFTSYLKMINLFQLQFINKNIIKFIIENLNTEDLTDFEKFHTIFNLMKLDNYDKELDINLKEKFDFKLTAFTIYYSNQLIISSIESKNNFFYLNLIYYFKKNNNLLNINHYFEIFSKINFLYYICQQNPKFIFNIFIYFLDYIKILDKTILIHEFFNFMKILNEFDYNKNILALIYYKFYLEYFNNKNLIIPTNNKLIMWNLISKYYDTDYKIIVNIYKYTKLDNNNNYLIVLEYYKIYLEKNLIDNNINIKIDNLIKESIVNFQSNDIDLIVNSICIFLSLPKNKINSINIYEKFIKNIKLLNLKLIYKLIRFISFDKILDNKEINIKILKDIIIILPKFYTEIYKEKDKFNYIVLKLFKLNYFDEKCNDFVLNIIEKSNLVFNFFEIYKINKFILYLNYYNQKIIKNLLKFSNSLNIYKIISLLNNKIKIENKFLEELIIKEKTLIDINIFHFIVYDLLITEEISIKNYKVYKNLFSKKIETKKNLKLDSLVFYYSYNILKKIENNSEISDLMKKKLYNISNLQNSLSEYFIKYSYPIKLISWYLKLLNIDHIINPTFLNDEINIIYLKEENIIINIILEDEIFKNINKNSSVLELKIKFLKSLIKDVKILNIDYINFLKLKDNLKRIDLILKYLGIKYQDDKNLLDYSEIDDFIVNNKKIEEDDLILNKFNYEDDYELIKDEIVDYN